MPLEEDDKQRIYALGIVLTMVIAAFFVSPSLALNL
jgi:hypothetical protein